MSKIIPRRTIDALRVFRDVSLDNYGIDCDIYIPNNVGTVEDYDIYAKPADYEYTHYTGTVWIEWSPNIHRLRNIGIFTEDQLPILARMPRKATADDAVIRNIDVIRRSYIKIDMEFIPDSVEKAEEFEVVDILLGQAHDAAVNPMHIIAPRRLKVS